MGRFGAVRRISRDLRWFTALIAGIFDGQRWKKRIRPAVQQFEMALEWNYGLAIRPGLLLQPDVQYLVHPNGNTRINNAVAVGVNIVVNF
jgi:carbohydrate-selective porin OprB